MTLKQWVQKWRETGRRLEEVRHENIRLTNTSEAILSFNDAFTYAIQHSSPKSSSGLVAQQNIFKKMRNR